MKAVSTKLQQENSKRSLHCIDAKGKVLGRVAEEAAGHLIGKHYPTYVPYTFCGDAVEIINAKHIVLTGNKDAQKMYYWHSQKIGNLKSMTATELRKSQPNRMLYQAIKGMLPKNKLRDVQLAHLSIFNAERPVKA